MMSKRKRIVFIGFTKIKYMPYMHFYLDMIPVNEYEIHLIYWNRDNGNDQVLNSSVALHPFNKEMGRHNSFTKEDIFNLTHLGNTP